MRYEDVRLRAQRRADALGCDVGVWRRPDGSWGARVLPARSERSGDDLACEVVSPICLEKARPGHGPLGDWGTGERFHGALGSRVEEEENARKRRRGRRR